MPAYIRTRSEFAVNSFTSLNQVAPTVATFADGGFIIAWGTSDPAQDGSESAIKAQLFDSAGRKVGPEFLVNATGAGYQFTAEVATLSGGAFVVTWVSLAPDGAYSIRAQIFDRNGGAIGSEFQVNPAGSQSTFTPNIAALANGGFVVSWDQGGDVKAQIFGSTGSRVGSVFTMNTKTDYSQEYGDMTALAGGGFVATWRTSDSTADGSSYALKAQVFSATGAKVGLEFLVNSQGTSYQYSPSITALSGGGFVVTWQTGDTAQDGSATAIKAQIFSASGAKVGAEFLVNTQAADTQQSPVVTSVPGGGFLVAWQTLNSAQDGSGAAIKAQMFDSSGTKVGGEMLVNTLATGSQSMPDLATLADGRVIATWTSESGDISGPSIRAQILGAELAAPLANTAPTIISNGGGTAVALTQDEGVWAVTTVVASDDGEPNNLRYSITGGADAAKFMISATTGVLAFKSNPDHVEGGDNVYDVTVTASDGQLTGSQSFVITLRHVNYVTIVSDGGYDWASLSVNENQTAVTIVAAVDDDGAPLTYSITGGQDAAFFTIDPQTGALSFTVAPDYEAPANAYGDNVYYVKVTATDGTRSDTQELAVEIMDVEEPDGFAIVSDGGGDQAEVSILENSTQVTTVAVSGAAGPVTYEIVGGAHSEYFTIDPETGILSFLSPPDYEAYRYSPYPSPYPYYPSYVYNVIVRASDGVYTDDQDLQVIVGNVDEAPVFYSFGGEAEVALPVAENSLVVGSVVAYDDDSPSSSITYWLAGGADAFLFEVDSLSGELRFKQAPDYEARGDADGDNVYEVAVEALSGMLSATQSFWIYVRNEGEQTVITSGGGEPEAVVTVAENGTVVTVVEASGDSYISYEIAGGADAGAFIIDPYTGVLEFSGAADFEAPGDSDQDNVYEVTVRASDGLTSDDQQLRVQLQNVNEAVTITSGAAFAVLENGTAVTVVSAVDADGDQIGFSLAGGADAALFDIDAATGALSFKSAPSFEAPADSDGDNVYEVDVSASDGSQSVTKSLSVQVVDHSESIAFVSGGGGDTAAVTMDENSGDVLGLLAVDPDGGTPQYGISGGADAALFEIDPATGMLRFKDLPDFETTRDADGNNVYEVTVSATDGQSSDHQSVSVTVANVYEGVRFAAPSRAFALDEGGVVIGSVSARGEAGASIAYSISGGADASLFRIDPVTGALSWIAAPDFDSPADSGGDNVYDLIVTAGDGTASATQALTVTVGNVDERPVFAPGAAQLRIDEGTTAVTILAAADPEGAAVSFAISGGADAALFAIDSATGALSFLAAPDFEAPADSGGDNVYEVEVSAGDGQLSQSKSLSIEVADLSPPVAVGDEFVVNATFQRTQAHSDVTRLADGNFVVTWIDADFNTTAGRFLRAQVFAPDGVKIGGELTLASGNGVGTEPAVAALPDGGFVVATRPLGSIAVQMFDLAGAATSAKLTVSNAGSAVGEPQIAVLANGGFAITWDDSRSAGADASGSGVHLRVYDSAGAPVGGDVLVNTSTAGNQADPSISALAGGGYVVTWTDRPGQGASWVAKAQIFDSAGARVGGEFVVSQPSSSMGTVVETSVVTLANGNFAVAWSESDQSGPAHRIQIFTPAGVKVGGQIVSPSNAYGTSVGPSLTALSDGGFAVAWSPNNPPQYDGSGKAIFVQAYDSAGQARGPALRVNGQAAGDQLDPSIAGLGDGRFVVTWTDLAGAGADDDQVMARIFAPEGYVPNQRPVITSGGGGVSASVAIDEGRSEVTTVAATDSDGPSAVTYSIDGGADAALFRIDSATGALSFVAAPDYEAPAGGSNNVYAVTVKASDGELSSVQSLQVTVRDVNEGVAITTGPSLSVNEDSAFVAKVAASDADGDPLSYAIVGGADASHFTIDPATGDLSIRASLDYEAPADADGDNVYEVTVRASDGELFDERQMSITVNDVYDDVEIVSYGGAGSVSLAIQEGGSFQVADVDASMSSLSGVRFAIAGGADASLFTIDPNEGTLSFNYPFMPNFEAPGDADGDNVYDVVVVASLGTSSDSQAFAVTVTNRNEGLWITSDGQGDANLSVNEGGRHVTTVTAFDPDGDVPVYSILGGADASKFAIDPATGVLTFIAAPDHEAPQSAAGTNLYTVEVGASDGEHMSRQKIRVAVDNVNEGVTITSGGGGNGAAVTVAENGLAVMALAATDADGDPLTYSISGGADSARFAIDPRTGALSFVQAPNFEAPADSGGNNVYDVLVSVTDGVFTDTQALAITVGNLNEGVSITSSGGGASAALGVAENGTAVVTVAAADIDGGAVTYSIAGGADAARFTINAATGVLAFISAPNYEAPADSGGNNVYDVIVSATDGTFTDSQALAVTVGNVNEAIAITSNGGGAAAAGSVAENGRYVLTVAATDPDGTLPTYSIVGGADAARFTIDPKSGVLQFVSAPDHELPGDSNGDNVYAVIVRASDGQLFDDQSLSLTVTNMRDGAVVTGTSGSDSISASSLSPALRTTNSEDTVFGRDGHDNIQGMAGDDELYGEGGNDTITGGAGADRLSGGLGKDQFTYNSASESSGAAIDMITDFSRSQGDKISLSAIDANSLVSSNQAFTFIGSAAFSNVAGQLRYETSGGVTTISGDINGDGVADLQIQLSGSIALIASDFIL